MPWPRARRRRGREGEREREEEEAETEEEEGGHDVPLTAGAVTVAPGIMSTREEAEREGTRADGDGSGSCCACVQRPENRQRLVRIGWLLGHR
jgi:hypothetical protein